MKWSPVEVFLARCKDFSEFTDSWSFGITAWEVYTYAGWFPDMTCPVYLYFGCQRSQHIDIYSIVFFRSTAKPYDGIPTMQLPKKLKQGHRLTNPGCSDKVFTKLRQCWDDNALDRPRFSELRSFFKEVTEEAMVTEYVCLGGREASARVVLYAAVCSSLLVLCQDAHVFARVFGYAAVGWTLSKSVSETSGLFSPKHRNCESRQECRHLSAVLVFCFDNLFESAVAGQLHHPSLFNI